MIYMLLYEVDYEGFEAPIGVYATVEESVKKAHDDQAKQWEWDSFSVFGIDPASMTCALVKRVKREGERFP